MTDLQKQKEYQKMIRMLGDGDLYEEITEQIEANDIDVITTDQTEEVEEEKQK